ncbi:MAG: ABC transporter substrate-binding protein [Acidobacteriota bacterium]
MKTAPSREHSTKRLTRRSLLGSLGALGLGASACTAQTPGVQEGQASDSGLKLTLAMIENYDRTGPVLNGTVKLDGIDPIPIKAGPAELFRQVAQEAAYDISEMSTSTYMILKSQGDDRYTGLPVFPSRNFRHGYVFVNDHSGIIRPEDLAGKRIGVPEYQTTAALWQRTFLQDDYDVTAEQIDWFEGGLDEPNAPERFHVDVPSNIRLSRIGEGETLSKLLEDGDLDAVVGPAAPECFGRANHIARLFPDYRQVEQDYYRRTGFFPIMHMVVVRSEVYRANPWVAQSIFQAFQRAKTLGFERLNQTWDLPCALPWIMSDLEEIETIFDGDHWPYGIAENNALLERMTQASYEQGLSKRKLEVQELFAKETWGS